MYRRLALLPLLALAGASLSGCVAVAIPVIAGSAMAGSRLDGKDATPDVAAAVPAIVTPVPAPAPAPAPAPTPVVKVIPLPPAPVVIAAAPPPPSPVAVAVPAPVPVPVPATPPPVAVTVAAPAATLPGAPRQSAAYPDPANPLTPGQSSFARFVRYGQASALGVRNGADLQSAMLQDPIAIDGQRRRCEAGEQPVALIDLDPKGGVFSPPANPAEQRGIALGLAVLREAGVVIAWLSDLPVNESGAVRTALEHSGLDPRGEDIISLRRDADDRKQQRKDNLAGITCIIAIAGDERPDFDERFKYLRNPEAGAELEPVIGDGWFLIEPVFADQGKGQ